MGAMGALAPANFETRTNCTRNFGTIYYCQHPLAPVNGTSYYCQHPQFKIPKYTPVLIKPRHLMEKFPL